MIDAGRRNRQVQLLRPEPQRDAMTGEASVKYVEELTVWAAVEPLGSREQRAAAQRFADADLVLTTEWFEEVDATWGVLYGVRVYELLSVEEIGMREGLRLVARGRAESGAPEPRR